MYKVLPDMLVLSFMRCPCSYLRGGMHSVIGFAHGPIADGAPAGWFTEQDILQDQENGRNSY
jgi:hypothetical protein